MKLLFLVITMFSLGSTSNAISQEINWKDAKHWRLYNLHKQSAFNLPIDSLKLYKSIGLADDSMQKFSREIKSLERSESGVWMGLYVVTFETSEGNLKKIVISNYGGFLYDPQNKTYYGLPEDLREEWYDLLNEKSKTLMIEGSK